MPTRTERSLNNRYLVWNEKENIKEIGSYRSNVIKVIQERIDPSKYSEIAAFSSKSVTDERFERFVQLAGEAGYTIYKVIKL